MKQSFVAATVMTLMLSTTLLGGCVNKTPLVAEHKAYAGRWEAGDGTWVQFYFDGGGDLKTSNTEITGGAATFKGDAVTIGMGPIAKSFHIDQAPQQQDGKWLLVLDGVTYTKSGLVHTDAADAGSTKSNTEASDSAPGSEQPARESDSKDDESGDSKELRKPDPIPLDIKN